MDDETLSDKDRELPRCTQALLLDLMAKPLSAAREDLIRWARKHRYHDYLSEHATPCVQLVHDLTAAGYADLAAKAAAGAYDAGKEDAEAWMQSPEAQKIARDLMGPAGGPEPAHPERDDEEQKRTRAIGREIGHLMDKHGVGGVVLICSEAAVSWTEVWPAWSAIQSDPVHRFRFRMKAAEYPSREVANRVAENTLHMLGSLKDMCADFNSLYGRFWRQVVGEMKRQGVVVEHEPLAKRRGVGGRPDPQGGKID